MCLSRASLDTAAAAAAGASRSRSRSTVERENGESENNGRPCNSSSLQPRARTKEGD